MFTCPEGQYANEDDFVCEDKHFYDKWCRLFQRLHFLLLWWSRWLYILHRRTHSSKLYVQAVHLLPGLMMTDDNTCIEECGDGVFLGLTSECDDGNIVGGDRCSEECTVEFGYACDGGTLCREIIPP